MFSTIWLLLLVLAANGTIYVVFQKTIENEAVERAETQMDNMAEALHTADASMDMSRFLRAYLPADSMIRIISEDGKSLLDYHKSRDDRATYGLP